jgi:uncharacterized membrane protein
MQNRTVAIIITAVTAAICGCLSIISCVWGGIIATGTPINVTQNGVTTPQTFSPTIGYVLLCLTLLMILVPVAVGFFTLRKKPEATGVPDINEPIPPAS